MGYSSDTCELSTGGGGRGGGMEGGMEAGRTGSSVILPHAALHCERSGGRPEVEARASWEVTPPKPYCARLTCGLTALTEPCPTLPCLSRQHLSGAGSLDRDGSSSSDDISASISDTDSSQESTAPSSSAPLHCSPAE